MKNIYSYLMVLAAALGLSACENAGDKIVLEGFGSDTEISLMASRTAVEITTENTALLALQFAWRIPELVLSEFTVAEGVLTYKLEFSLSPDFATKTTLDVSGNSHSFTGGSLNAVMNRIPVEFDVPNTTYVRLAVYTGPNMDAVYSEEKTISISPFEIDFTVMWVVGSNDMSEVLGSIHSPDADGEYSGIVYMTAWKNGYYMAGDGTVYGSKPVDGNPFYLTTASDMWNFWFPGASGYYYVQLSLNSMEWSASFLAGLNVTDAATDTSLGSMTLASGVYTGVFETAGSTDIYVAGTGRTYDKVSETSDDKAAAFPFWFYGSGSATSGDLGFSTAKPTETISVTTADTYTLAMNPAEMNYTITSGGEIPVTYPDKLYMWYQNDRTVYHTVLTQGETGIYSGVYYTVGNDESFYLSDGETWDDSTIYGCTDSSQAIVSVPASEFTTDLWALWFGETAGTFNEVVVDLTTKTWSYTETEFPETLYMWYKEDHTAYHTVLTQGEAGVYSAVYYTSGDWEGFYLTDGILWDNSTIYGCTDNTQTIVSVPAADFNAETYWSLWFGGTAGMSNKVVVDLNTNTWSYTSADTPANLYMWYKEDHTAYHTVLSQTDLGVYGGVYYTAGDWENFYLTSGETWEDSTIYGCVDNSQSVVSVPAAEFNADTNWSFWFGATAGTSNDVVVNLNTDIWSYTTAN